MALTNDPCVCGAVGAAGAVLQQKAAVLQPRLTEQRVRREGGRSRRAAGCSLERGLTRRSVELHREELEGEGRKDGRFSAVKSLSPWILFQGKFLQPQCSRSIHPDWTKRWRCAVGSSPRQPGAG